MKQTSKEEFDAMTLSKATDFKKALGLEMVDLMIMDNRTKEHARLDILHSKNVSNLADSKWGSAVQDELIRRDKEARG